jgi:hypothetical protein
MKQSFTDEFLDETPSAQAKTRHRDDFETGCSAAEWSQAGN